MTGASTTREEVERLALSLEIADQPVTAATLRALLDERDGLDAVNDQAVGRVQDLLAENAALAAERDAARAEVERMREAHDELSRYSDAEITRLRRLWTYLQEAAADLDADEPMKAAEWLAEFDQAEKARAALAGAPSHDHPR